MSKLGLTHDEKNLLNEVATRRGTKADMIGAYAAWLGPILAFAVYGVFKKDLIAIEMAFACLCGFTLWHIWRSLRSTGLFRSIVLKIVAFDRDD